MATTRSRSAFDASLSNSSSMAQATPHVARSRMRQSLHSNVLVALAAPLPSTQQHILASPFRQRRMNQKARLEAIMSKVAALNSGPAPEEEYFEEPLDGKENAAALDEQDEADRHWAELNAQHDEPIKTPRRLTPSRSAKKRVSGVLSARGTPFKNIEHTKSRRSSMRGSALKTPASTVVEISGNSGESVFEDEEFGGQILDEQPIDDEDAHFVRPSASAKSLTPTTFMRTRKSLTVHLDVSASPIAKRASHEEQEAAELDEWMRTRRSDRRSLHHNQLQLLQQLMRDGVAGTEEDEDSDEMEETSATPIAPLDLASVSSTSEATEEVGEMAVAVDPTVVESLIEAVDSAPIVELEQVASRTATPKFTRKTRNSVAAATAATVSHAVNEPIDEAVPHQQPQAVTPKSTRKAARLNKAAGVEPNVAASVMEEQVSERLDQPQVLTQSPRHSRAATPKSTRKGRKSTYIPISTQTASPFPVVANGVETKSAEETQLQEAVHKHRIVTPKSSRKMRKSIATLAASPAVVSSAPFIDAELLAPSAAVVATTTPARLSQPAVSSTQTPAAPSTTAKHTPTTMRRRRMLIDAIESAEAAEALFSSARSVQSETDSKASSGLALTLHGITLPSQSPVRKNAPKSLPSSAVRLSRSRSSMSLAEVQAAAAIPLPEDAESESAPLVATPTLASPRSGQITPRSPSRIKSMQAREEEAEISISVEGPATVDLGSSPHFAAEELLAQRSTPALIAMTPRKSTRTSPQTSPAEAEIQMSPSISLLHSIPYHRSSLGCPSAVGTENMVVVAPEEQSELTLPLQAPAPKRRSMAALQDLLASSNNTPASSPMPVPVAAPIISASYPRSSRSVASSPTDSISDTAGEGDLVLTCTQSRRSKKSLLRALTASTGDALPDEVLAQLFVTKSMEVDPPSVAAHAAATSVITFSPIKRVSTIPSHTPAKKQSVEDAFVTELTTDSSMAAAPVVDVSCNSASLSACASPSLHIPTTPALSFADTAVAFELPATPTPEPVEFSKAQEIAMLPSVSTQVPKADVAVQNVMVKQQHPRSSHMRDFAGIALCVALLSGIVYTHMQYFGY